MLAEMRGGRLGDDYWQDFICEFHHRQRARSRPVTGVRGFWRRFDRMVGDSGPGKWAYGAGLAYAALSVCFLLFPSEPQSTGHGQVPVHHLRVPPPWEAQAAKNAAPAAQEREGDEEPAKRETPQLDAEVF